jgi:nitroimidazol reductase NimA-like FMN-containing flavoprotein (pyridoxamine 5'-phosphate oxidase superfamily)
MTTPEDERQGRVAVMDTLPAAECWNLLSTAPLGRLGLLVGGRPQVLPVNYALDGRAVLFRTAEGTVLNEAGLRVVAFEVDHVDAATHEGWSVLVQGLARDITDAVDANSARMRRLSLITWAPGARHRWYRIEPEHVSGRRLRVVPDAL